MSAGWAARQKITFEDFGVIETSQALKLGLDPQVKPLWVRLVFVALGRSNRIGHATFAPGELSKLMSRPHRDRPDVVHHPSSQQLCAAIDRAVELGFLEDDSGVRCLRPNVDLWEKQGGKGTRTCYAHNQVR